MVRRIFRPGVALAALLTISACTVSSTVGESSSPAPTTDSRASETGTASTATSVPPSSTVTDPLDGVSIEDIVFPALRSRGVQVQGPEPRQGTSFGVPGTISILDEDDWMVLTEFSDEHFAITQTTSMREDERVVLDHQDYGYGLPPGTHSQFVFLMGKVAIEYVGDNPVVPNTLRDLGASLVSGGTVPLAGGADMVKQIFTDRGFEITEPDQFALGMEMPTGHRSKFFYIDGEEVHVWAYPAGQRHFGGTTRLDGLARGISSDGMSYEHGDESTPFTWNGAPHFYQQGGAIALYVGDNQAIIETLRDIAGHEFAGGDMHEPYPVTGTSLKAQLEGLGLTVEPKGTAPDDSPFESPGELWLLNGQPVEVFIFAGPSLTPYGVRFADRRHRWPATPQLFERENAAVFYVGEDRAVTDALERVFGWNEMSVGVPPEVRMGTAAGELEPAPIADVQVYSRQPEMPGFVALVVSENGGCVHYDHYTLERVEHRFVIEVFNRDSATAHEPRDDGAVWGCTLDLRSYRTYVPLDEGLVTGQEYVVEVNGKEWGTFIAE